MIIVSCWVGHIAHSNLTEVNLGPRLDICQSGSIGRSRSNEASIALASPKSKIQWPELRTCRARAYPASPASAWDRVSFVHAATESLRGN
jgi:hypothetical protein